MLNYSWYDHIYYDELSSVTEAITAVIYTVDYFNINTQENDLKNEVWTPVGTILFL